MPSKQIDVQSKTKLGQLIQERLKEHPGENALYPLVRGDEALIARLVSIRLAEKSLDLQYYIWHGDLSGRFLMSEVYKAAERGVRVRLLLDDLNQSKFQKELFLLDKHPHIEVRMVNPFAHREFQALDLTRFRKINRRMHNKSFTVDNQLTIVGGRNIGDEYFDASGTFNMGDFDVWMAGPIVKKVSEQFDIYWNSEISFPIATLVNRNVDEEDEKRLYESLNKAHEDAVNSPYAKAILNEYMKEDFSKVPRNVFWGKVSVFFDPPFKLVNIDNKPAHYLGEQLRPNVEVLKKELILISPYFVPGKKGMKLLKGLQKRGIEITVLTNSLASSDVSSVFAGYKKYRKELIKSGIHLYELRPKQPEIIKKKRFFASSGSLTGLHTKAFIFDRKRVFIGSMNLDPRSSQLNTEMGVVTYDEVFAENMGKELLETLPEIAYEIKIEDGDIRWMKKDGSRIKELKKEPETSWWKRFKALLSGWFVPEELL